MPAPQGRGISGKILQKASNQTRRYYQYAIDVENEKKKIENLRNRAINSLKYNIKKRIISENKPLGIIEKEVIKKVPFEVEIEVPIEIPYEIVEETETEIVVEKLIRHPQWFYTTFYLSIMFSCSQFLGLIL